MGVDIFFVISGYLITSLVAKEMAQGNFSIVSFYERRIRRIFPALFGVVFFCVIVAAAMLTPKDFLAFAKTLLAMTGFGSNLFFADSNGGMNGYFGRVSQTQVLLHTWSLSVEEQFYLFFPALLFVLMSWAGPRAAKALSIIAILSFGLGVWTLQSNPVDAFYLLRPRAWELLLGSLLALKLIPFTLGRFQRELAIILGLGLISYSVCFFSHDTSFPGPSALLPCLGAALVIYAGEAGPSFLKSALSFSPLVFIGVLSYSLYLWHWPIIVFTRYFFVGDLNTLETLVVILASFALAFFSFEFIEKPFRGKESALTRRQIFSLGVTASIISAGLAGVIVLRHGFPRRFPETTKELIYQNEARKDDFENTCVNWKLAVRDFSDIDSCATDPNSPRKILFWGDSHVQQLIPVVKKLHDAGELNEHGFLFATSGNCAPAEHLNFAEKGFHCDTFSSVAMRRAREPDIDVVFIGSQAGWGFVKGWICPSVDGRCVGTISVDEAARRVLGELSSNVRELKSRGKRVIVGLPFPVYDKWIPDVEIHNAMFARFGWSEVATDLVPPHLRDQIAETAQSAGADLFDPRATLCNPQGCITQIDGVSIYRDDEHLAKSQVGILEPSLKQVLLRNQP